MRFTKKLEEKVRKRSAELGHPTRGSILRTIMWYYKLFEKDIQRKVQIDPWDGRDFYADPPIKNPKSSSRVLVIGTKVEVRNIAEMFESPERINENNPPEYNHKARSRLKKLIEEARQGTVEYCAQLNQFWSAFFGEEDFLDDPITLPTKMIATGLMRDYMDGCGMYRHIKERLKEISFTYNVPLEFIKPFSWIALKNP